MAEPTPPNSGGLRIAPHLDLEHTKLLPTDPSAEQPKPLFAGPAELPSPAAGPQARRGPGRRLGWWITLTALFLVAAALLLR